MRNGKRKSYAPTTKYTLQTLAILSAVKTKRHNDK